MSESGQNFQAKDKQKAQRVEDHARNQETSEVVYCNRTPKNRSDDFELSLLSVFNFGREPRFVFKIIYKGVFQEIRV
jgi:hypothetical protein